MTLKRLAGWLTTQEAADLLDLSEQRVRVLAKQQKIRSVLKGRTYLFERRDVETFKQQDRKSGRPQKHLK